MNHHGDCMRLPPRSQACSTHGHLCSGAFTCFGVVLALAVQYSGVDTVSMVSKHQRFHQLVDWVRQNDGFVSCSSMLTITESESLFSSYMLRCYIGCLGHVILSQNQYLRCLQRLATLMELEKVQCCKPWDQWMLVKV